ncbi:unnamed protein product [Symbiodinium sp. CCMP2592]|nr:unnamed protein product [Symbiodinium sp. CCMP2592]
MSEPCEASEAEEDDTEVFTEPDESARQMMLRQKAPLDQTISAMEGRCEELPPQMRGGKRVTGQRQHKPKRSKEFTMECSLHGQENKQEFMIPQAAFRRLFKETAETVTAALEADLEQMALLPEEKKKKGRGRPRKERCLTVPQFPKSATRIAQYMAEDFLQARFSDASRLAQHSKRETTMLRDLKLAGELRAGALEKRREDNEFRVYQSVLAERRRR